MSAHCPRCGLTVATKGCGYGTAEYVNHSIRPGAKTLCLMSKQIVPAQGLSDKDFEARAVIVANLAEQVQDADPAVVMAYLQCLPPSEKDIMMMIALAGMNCDGRIEDIFGWVCDLPVAQAVSA